MLAGILLLLSIHAESQDVRKTLAMDFGWKFHLGEVEQARETNYDDSDWRDIRLPHDWSIELPFSEDAPAGGGGGYLPGGIGWYRKAFTLSPSDAAGKITIEAGSEGLEGATIEIKTSE